MSLISDALKKGGAAPPQSPALPPSPPKPRFKKGAAWFSAILIFAGVFLLRYESASRRALPPQPLLPSQGQPVALQDDSVPKPAPSQPQRPGLNLLRAAENSWKLNGVLRGGDGQPLALINNQVVEQGAIVRGAKLVRVNDTSVELEEEDGQTHTLKLR